MEVCHLHIMDPYTCRYFHIQADNSFRPVNHLFLKRQTEMCDLIEIFIYLVSIISDIVSFIESKDNRRNRRQAKQSGQVPPGLDKWSKLFITLSTIVVIFTVYFIWKHFIARY